MTYNKHKKRSHRSHREGLQAMQRFKNARPPKRYLRRSRGLFADMINALKARFRTK